MNIFDIIGPVMIGPSSSHTAGAVRIGRVGAKILGQEVAKADIRMSGSFAQTYRGHGTDKAIVAGLLGMLPDDERIPNSFAVAQERGLVFAISAVQIPHAHPNTVSLHLSGRDGKECALQGSSVGGGNINITNVNHMDTEFSGDADTLIIAHWDMPGMIASVTGTMAELGINIGNFKLNRPHRGFQAVMTLETDGAVTADAIARLRALPHIDSIVYLRPNQSGE